MEWGGNNARSEHILDRNRVTEFGQRVKGRVPAHGDGNFGELRTGRTELMHVALGHYRVVADGRRAVGALKVFRRIRTAAATGANGKTVRRPGAAVENQRDVAITGGNGRGGMAGVG